MIEVPFVLSCIDLFGIIGGIASFFIIIKKSKYIIGWLDYLAKALLAAIIGLCLWSILLIFLSLTAARLMIIDSEATHATYFLFGEQKEQFLIELNPGKFYVQNRMNKSIIIHTVKRNDKSQIYEIIVLRPDQISSIHYCPVFFFDKNAPKYSRPEKIQEDVPWNAVDYYNE